MSTTMDKWPKEKLIEEVKKLEEQLKYYQTKLRDLVRAYKSLVKEKTALESSFQTLQCVSITNSDKTDVDSQLSENPDTLTYGENVNQVPDQKTEITTLINSLSVLSAEKCRMEASFQADKKLLRQEKEKSDLYIRELEEKFKKMNSELTKEIENLKSKLIIARHDRDKDQNDNSIRMRELQRLLAQEREEKENVQKTLAELTPKFEMLLNKEEIDRFQETDISEKLVNLQKKHLSMLEDERRRVLQAENDSKALITAHERRVASLETRVTELSHTVANYHRLRQQDQNEIIKLKAHIEELCSCSEQTIESTDETESLKEKNEMELNSYLHCLVEKVMKYKELISAINQSCDKPVDLHMLLCDDCERDKQTNTHSLEEYQILKHEYDKLQDQYHEIIAKDTEIESLKIKVQVSQDQIAILNQEFESTIRKYEKQIDTYKIQINTMNTKHKDEMRSTENNLKAQIFELEQQLQKQRDRTLALLDEKEQEVSTLKSTFQVFLPRHKDSFPRDSNMEKMQAKRFQLSGILNGIDNSTESPHILHYSHELARKDVELSVVRKSCVQLETALRETTRDAILMRQKHNEELSAIKEEVARLQLCQSREGANLEYLKNVIVNYLLSKDVSSKRHMFNAIAAVLKFNDSEITMIRSNF